MKQLKHKKPLLAAAGAVTLVVAIVYMWVGAFVLQIFPRNQPQTPTQVTNSDQLGQDFRNGNYGTLSEVDEKPEPSPQTTAPQPQDPSDNSQSEHGKTVPGKKNGIFRHFGL